MGCRSFYSCNRWVHTLTTPFKLLKVTVEMCSLLNSSTKQGFDTNRRGLRTLLVGIDIRKRARPHPNISIRIEACIHARAGNQITALETIFYQLCNLLEAPVTPVFVFDGPGRPAVKRGIRRVRNNPLWIINHLKELLTAFGYHFIRFALDLSGAPGEAEAELAQLNRLGFIDAVISEDSDTIVFGAPCVIRTSGPYVIDASQIYTSAAISAHPLYLDDDGLLLFVLLVGGDYDRGLAHCGPKIATALAQCGFGRDLRRILTTFGGAELQEELGLWREALKAELKSNVSGHLDKRYPKLANEVNSSFPNLDVAELYMDPLTSWSSPAPETSEWIPREPHVDQVSSFCVAHFGWESILLDRLKANFWPGVASRMLFSVRKLCSRLHLSSNDCFQEVPHL
ncbi:PIN domain-like protein [Mycena olivaceomarginata]|nr:PIN domain-like protein [Mycena olivaceomarginata]